MDSMIDDEKEQEINVRKHKRKAGISPIFIIYYPTQNDWGTVEEKMMLNWSCLCLWIEFPVSGDEGLSRIQLSRSQESLGRQASNLLSYESVRRTCEA